MCRSGNCVDYVSVWNRHFSDVGGAYHVGNISIKEKVSFLVSSFRELKKKKHFYLAKIYGKI